MLLSTQTKPVTWSDRLHLAWFFVHFCQALRNGVVTFSFWKKDGSIREAKGTTHPLLIPLDKRPKGTDKMVNGKWSMVNYFDLDRNDWRSFNITHFIGFVTIYQLSPFHSSGDQVGIKLKDGDKPDEMGDIEGAPVITIEVEIRDVLVIGYW